MAGKGKKMHGYKVPKGFTLRCTDNIKRQEAAQGAVEEDCARHVQVSRRPEQRHLRHKA
jgi:hypothetical protein